MNSLDQLKSYLDHDPSNETLRLECAETAIHTKHFNDALTLLKPLLESEHKKAVELTGLIAIKKGQYDEANKIYSTLASKNPRDFSLQFNQSWSLAKLGRFEDALSIMDEDCARSLPQAASLMVQLYHQLGDFDKAGSSAREYTHIFPNYPDLAAVASTVAMDIDDPEWARKLSELAPEHPDAMITLATLNLSEDTAHSSKALYDKALVKRPNSARALIGKGLAELLLGNSDEASDHLDKGAEAFGTHLGSWIAAGWSYAVKGDMKTARERFEHALSIDDSFSETHGSIGILNILEGDIQTGRKNIRTARRLDVNSASAALGQILILQSQGRAAAAQDVFEKAMQTPINSNGETLAQSMVKMGYR